MQQTSAQGIASLYRGNPEQLQQRIQKDQQAKPGLPPDLQEMLALQIVTNEEDSATAQKAMDQLKQMAGPSGKPPTVMASLQQQAAQKLQAQAVQAQQKQQGIQSLMQNVPASGVPEGTPQPEPQPEAQGIDQLPAEFDMAEGGIVAFDKGGEVDAAREQARAAMAKLRSYGLAQRRDDPEGFEAAQAQVAEANARLQAVQSAYAQEMSATGMDRPVQASGLPQARPQQAAPQATAPAAAYSNEGRTGARPYTPAPAPAKDIKELAALRTPAPAPTPAPVMEEAPAPAAPSAAQQMVTGRMNASPEDREAAEVAKYKRMVGEPDTAQHDRLIAELEKRKQALAPKQGFEGLMEYLGQISANSQPGRGSFASGAAGARGMEAINKDRALQQFELSKQAIEVSQKKLDTVRAYAKDVYGIGKSAFDQVYKDQYDAAKELVKDENEARKLAQENTLKRLQMQNNLAVQRLQNQGSLAVANARGATSATLSPNQRAEIANKAIDNVNAALKQNVPLQMKAAKDPTYMQQLITFETERLMAAAEGRTMNTAPGAAGPGGIPPDVQALLKKYGSK